jgi:hypothetical protein
LCKEAMIHGEVERVRRVTLASEREV